MFEKLLDLIIQIWDRLSPLQIIDAYEGGVVLRLGKYHRTLEPGLAWKIPLCERILGANTCVTTLRLPPQTLTTKDGVSIVVAAIVKYQIRDVRPFLIDIWDQVDVLADVVMGAIRMAVQDSTYDDARQSGTERKVLELARKDVNKYGFQLLVITFTDFGRVRSLRLILPQAKDLAN